LSPPGAVLTAAEAEPLLETGTDESDVPVSVLSLRGKPEPRVTTRVARELIAKGLAKVENERGPRLRTIRLSVESCSVSKAVEALNAQESADGRRPSDTAAAGPQMRISNWGKIEHELVLFGTGGISALDHGKVTSHPRPQRATPPNKSALVRPSGVLPIRPNGVYVTRRKERRLALVGAALVNKQLARAAQKSLEK
jgi:hypothetical protein